MVILLQVFEQLFSYIYVLFIFNYLALLVLEKSTEFKLNSKGVIQKFVLVIIEWLFAIWVVLWISTALVELIINSNQTVWLIIVVLFKLVVFFNIFHDAISYKILTDIELVLGHHSRVLQRLALTHIDHLSIGLFWVT